MVSLLFFQEFLVLELLKLALFGNRAIVLTHPVWELELVNKRLLESTFVRLTSKYYHLVLDVVIGHTEVVAAWELGNKSCLSKWSPNLCGDVKD